MYFLRSRFRARPLQRPTSPGINRRLTAVSPEQRRDFLAEKSKYNTRRILFFSLFCAYALLAVLGTSDYDILLKQSIEIPGLRITLPLITFYMVTPLAILILHFGVLWMHEHYLQELQKLPRETIKAIPFSILDASHLGANRILKFGVHVLVYLFPPVVLFFFLYWFADYQSLKYTFCHLAFLIICLIVDLVFIYKYRWPGIKWHLKILALLPHSFLFFFSIAYFFSFYFFLKSPSDFLEYSSRFLTDNQMKILRARLPHLKVTHCNLNKNFDLNEAKAYRELDNEKEKRPYLFYTTMVDLQNRNLILANLSYSKIVNFDLSGADLRNANLSKSQLQYSSLHLANLQEANLRGANLQDADLRDANLQGARVENANLQDAKLGGSRLENAKLKDANLQGAYLKEAKLQRAKLNSVNLQGAYLWAADLQETDLIGAKLERVELGFADLRKANLWGANLQGAHLRNTKLEGADLYGANLQGADLRDSKLQGAKLENANLQKANLLGANLQGAKLEFAELQGAYLGNANLQGAYLNQANLQGAVLDRTNLEGAYLGDANLQGAFLRYARLQGTFLIGAQLQGANLKCANFQGAYAGESLKDFVELTGKATLLSHLGDKKFTREDFKRLLKTIKSKPIYTLMDKTSIRKLTNLIEQAIGKTSLEWLEMQKGSYISGVLTWEDACNIQKNVISPEARKSMGLEKVNWEEKCK